MVYFDRTGQRLIFTLSRPSPEFWDSRWESIWNVRDSVLGTRGSFVSDRVKWFLAPSDGLILEGGCGNGQEVAALYNNGYKVTGVDFAPRTVERLHAEVPGLDIQFADVRCLPFPDSYFAGYISLGVIEHFAEGYDGVAIEMARVLKPGGYLFISFPHMSGIRRLKARLGLYKKWSGPLPADFYQFAFRTETVFVDFEKAGFSIVLVLPFSGFRGTMSEHSAVNPAGAGQAASGPIGAAARSVYCFVSRRILPFAAHSILVVMRKR